MGRIRHRRILYFPVFLVALLLALYIFADYNKGQISEFKDIYQSYRKSDAILKDRHGEILHEYRVDYQARRLEWTGLDDISPSLIKAVLYSEDKRFYSHSGVDILAFLRASVQNLVSNRRIGASTITMQLASMMDRGLRSGGRRSVLKKLKQVLAAWEIEKRWSKKQILEAYLNLVYFRGELQGIAAASRGIFQKKPDSLSPEESLVIASLIRSPNAGLEDIARRVKALNMSMGAGIPDKRIDNTVMQNLSTPYKIKPAVSIAPHVARYLIKDEQREVVCTLDRRIQMFVTEVLRGHISRLRDQNVTDGAAIVVDNRTGDILAYVGNLGVDSSYVYLDGIRAKRQAGSTLKPFLYAHAFDRLLLTPASELIDSPLDVTTEMGIYRPENYDRGYKGPVTARIALASSLNIPAVKVLMLLGQDEFVGKLNELGFSDLKDGEYYGYSLALGTLDVSLYELVNAYRTIANNGMYSSLNIVPGSGHIEKKRVFSKQASFIVSDILSDRDARSLTFGLENPLSTGFWSAVKTGTSKDMRDNWCIGFTERYTVGVWVGNFSGESMWNVSGIAGAAPVWHEIVRYLHRDTPSRPRPQPEGITVSHVFKGNRYGGKHEYFIKGTEPSAVGQIDRANVINPRITYPSRNMTIALDPDIPTQYQKIFFEYSGGPGDIKWVLNDDVIGEGRMLKWSPKEGHHRLKIVDRDNVALDEVDFQVGPPM